MYMRRFSQMSDDLKQNHGFSDTHIGQAMRDLAELNSYVTHPLRQNIVLIMKYFILTDVKGGEAVRGSSAIYPKMANPSAKVWLEMGHPETVSYLESRVFEASPKWFNKLLGVPVQTFTVKWNEDLRDFIYT